MLRAISERTLPTVTFYKPIGADDEHPGNASLVRGDYNAASIIYQIQQTFIWDDAVIIITYAENGGIWDHVTPPKIDRWGSGTGVPTIIVSPFAKRRFVDHTTYDTNLHTQTDRDTLGPHPVGRPRCPRGRSDQRSAARLGHRLMVPTHGRKSSTISMPSQITLMPQ